MVEELLKRWKNSQKELPPFYMSKNGVRTDFFSEKRVWWKWWKHFSYKLSSVEKNSGKKIKKNPRKFFNASIFNGNAFHLFHLFHFLGKNSVRTPKNRWKTQKRTSTFLLPPF